MTAGIVLWQVNALEFQDINRMSLQQEQKTVLKNCQGLIYKKRNMKNVKVIIEQGSDNRYSAYMDYYDLDFGLAGFGATSSDAIIDFYEAYEQEKRMSAKEGKETPELIFDFVAPEQAVNPIKVGKVEYEFA